MVKLARVRSILAETESTYGSDSSPTGSSNGIGKISSLEINPVESEVISRNLIRPFLGNSAQLIANTRVTVSFTVEYSGSGAAGTAPKYGPLIEACGFGETIVSSTSVTYAPISTTPESVTMYIDNDGIRHKVLGARGTFAISLNANQIPVINFTMTGQYVAPTDTASPSITVSNQVDPVVFNAANTNGFTLFSATGLALQSAEIDVGNNVVYRELVNASKDVRITDRAATANFVVECPALSTKDFFALAVAGTAGDLSIVHGTTAGNIITLASNSTGLSLGNPTYSESDGIVMLNLPTTMVPSSAGNNELTLAYT